MSGISIYESDLTQQVAAGVISQTQATQLWSNLSAADANRWRLGWVHLAYSVGGFLILGSITWFTSLVWQEQTIGLFLLASLYTLGFGYGGYAAWNNVYPTYKIPQVVGGIFMFVAVCTVPVAVFGLQRYEDYFLQDYPGIFQASSLAVSSIVGISLVPWSPLAAPLYAALFYIVEVDAAPLILGVPFAKVTAEQSDWVSVAFGFWILLTAAYSNSTKRSTFDVSFWGYLFGLLAFSGGLSDLYFNVYTGAHEDIYFRVAYVAVHLFLMAWGVKLQRVIFVVFGSLGASAAIVDFLITQATIAESCWFYVIFGSLLTTLAAEVQKRQPSSLFPFWGYAAGVMFVWGGYTTLFVWPVYTDWAFRIWYLVVNVFLLVASTYTKQRVFIIFGSMGVALWVWWLVMEEMSNSYWLPLVLIVLGLVFIALAIYFSTKDAERKKQMRLQLLIQRQEVEEQKLHGDYEESFVAMEAQVDVEQQQAAAEQQQPEESVVAEQQPQHPFVMPPQFLLPQQHQPQQLPVLYYVPYAPTVAPATTN